MIDFSLDLKNALHTIKSGGIILYPTDTIWGIGCDATQTKAVERIYRLKQREDSKSMLVLVDNIATLERIVPNIPSVAYDLVELATKPLTIIYDRAEGVADKLIATDGSLGIRVTKEAFSQSLCKALRRPLVSTSANISTAPSPRYFSDISPEIIAGVDYVVSYRQEERQEASPSQIIKLGQDAQIQIIRP